MNRLYLIVFSDDLKREDLTTFFDTQPSINFWFHNLPSSVFVRSNFSATQLMNLIQHRFGKVPTMIIVEVTGNYTGWIIDEHLKYF